MKSFTLILLCIVSLLFACEKDEPEINSNYWKKHPENPIYRDIIPDANYEVASDPHVFYDQQDQLKMIYTGDVDDRASILLASGNDFDEWNFDQRLLFETGPSGLDNYKETAFYHYSNGIHTIYYIGYSAVDYSNNALYRADATSLRGPYTQYADPIFAPGNLAGREVEIITSPSVVEHDGQLYLVFLGWDAFPEPEAVWVFGATSDDNGITWNNLQEVTVPIGMEGQLTKTPNGDFVAVYTTDFNGEEAIYQATADRPYGPWQLDDDPIVIKDNPELEKDEIIAPQITYRKNTNDPVLFYTGADHTRGWWIMMASPNTP